MKRVVKQLYLLEGGRREEEKLQYEKIEKSAHFDQIRLFSK